MSARRALVVLGLALAACAAWLALRAPRTGGSAAQGAAPAASGGVRSAAELAAPEGAPASGAAERVEVGPAAGAAVEEGVIEIRDARGAPVRLAAWALFRGDEMLANGLTTAEGSAHFARGRGAADLAVQPPHHPLQRFLCDLALERQTFALDAGAAVSGVALVDGVPPEPPLGLTLSCDSQLAPQAQLPPEVLAALGDPGRVQQLMTRTGADGSFRFDGLQPDWSGRLGWRGELFLLRAEDQEERGSDYHSLPLPGPVEGLRIELTAGARLTGRVVDPTTGEGLEAEIKVLFFGRGNGHGIYSRTEENGAFSYSFPEKLPERAEIGASTVDGGGVRLASFDLPDVRTYDVGAIPLRATRSVAFRVRDEGGRPLEGAQVSALSDRPEEQASATAGAEGLGTLTVALDARGLRAVAEGYEPALVALPAEGQRAELVLGPGTVLEVRLPSDLRGYRLRLQGSEPPFLRGGLPSWRPEMGSWQSAMRWDGERGSVELELEPEDQGGSVYVLSGVRPGLALALSVLDPYGSAAVELTVPALRAGERRVLEPAVPVALRTLAGRVVSASGEAIAGARVSAGAPGANQCVRSSTTADGRFSFRGLTAPSVELAVEAQGYARLVIQQPVVDTPLELVLDGGRDVRVTLQGPGGRPFPRVAPAWDVSVRAKLGASDVCWAKPGPEPGTYLLERAPSAAFTLAVAAGASEFEQACEAGLSAAAIELPAWQSCTVSVPGWKQLAWGDGSYVALRSLDADPPRRFIQARETPTDEEARFDVVFPGRYEVCVARTADFADPEQILSDVQVLEITEAAAYATLTLDAP